MVTGQEKCRAHVKREGVPNIALRNGAVTTVNEVPFVNIALVFSFSFFYSAQY